MRNLGRATQLVHNWHCQLVLAHCAAMGKLRHANVPVCTKECGWWVVLRGQC